MFCEATMRQCYILNTTAASFVDARAACQALGGDSDLVQYTNGAQYRPASLAASLK
jgi:hypothetical protein